MKPSDASKRWIEECCSPVVVTSVSPAVEEICLKNGLQFNDLLSSFGHLEDINCTVRSTNQNILFHNAHIRFENISETKDKTSDNVEKHLAQSMKAFDIGSLPGDVPELRHVKPSAWSNKLENIMMHSMAFSEYELLSHPLVLLMAVATNDPDPLAAMQQLTAKNRNPTGVLSGLYDPGDITRIYVLVHDSSISITGHVGSLYKQMQASYSSRRTRLVTFNFLSEEAANQHQPDMWSRWMIPPFFRDSSRQLTDSSDSKAVTPVLGARLSMDDFMLLRNFCCELFRQDIVPGLERRLTNLSKQVTDARKGVKNVLKSFWRKPREETSTAVTAAGVPVVRYRFDRIESQTLLLADSLFVVRDYDAALQMYKLVKDDYKADKSYLHLAHISYMMALCQFLLDPYRTKDILSLLDNLRESVVIGLTPGQNGAPLHAACYFAFIGCELYLSLHTAKATLEAAQFMLQSAFTVSRYPVMNALFVEKAATCYLTAGLYRKYSLYSMISGYKYQQTGFDACLSHSIVCFASTLLLFEGSRWGSSRSVLLQRLANMLRHKNVESSNRALLLMLHTVSGLVNDGTQIGGIQYEDDAINFFTDAMFMEGGKDQQWGAINTKDTWLANSSTKHLLLGALPLVESAVRDAEAGDALSSDDIEIDGLNVPEIKSSDIVLMCPVNGNALRMPCHSHTHRCEYKRHGPCAKDAALVMQKLLELESSWVDEREAETAPTSSNGQTFTSDDFEELASKCVDVEYDVANVFTLESRARETLLRHAVPVPHLQVPLGELVQLCLELRNTVPMALSVTQLHMELSSNDSSDASTSFVVANQDTVLKEGETQSVILTASPQSLGTFTVSSLSWRLGRNLVIRHPIHKEGHLLQKTLMQRCDRDRAIDSSLTFEVVAAQPLLEVSWKSFPKEVLNDEVICTELILHNDGAAAASSIEIKINNASYLLEKLPLDPSVGSGVCYLDRRGLSGSISKLPDSCVINPQQEISVRIWIKVNHGIGKQKLSILCTYRNEASPADSPRVSFCPTEFRVISSTAIQCRSVSRSTSVSKKTIVLSLTNNIPAREPKPNAIFRKDSVPSNAKAVEEVLGVLTNNEEVFSGGLSEGSCRVDAVLLLGPVRTDLSAAPTSSRSLITEPNEKATTCLPVCLTHITESNAPSDSSSGGKNSCATWFIEPSDRTFSVGGKDKQFSPLNKELVERLLCCDASSKTLGETIHRLKRQQQLEAENLEDQGPRTISQVRRDRKKEGGVDEVDGQPKSDLSTRDLAAGEELLYPTSALDLAKLQTQKGVSSHADLSFVVPAPAPSSATSTASATYSSVVSSTHSTSSSAITTTVKRSMSLPDYITIAIRHAPSVMLSAIDDGADNVPEHSTASVDVFVDIVSCFHNTLLLSMEALEKKLVLTTEKIASAASVKRGSVGTKGAEGAAVTGSQTNKQATALKGFRWKGQTKYSAVELTPHTSKTITFRASFSRKGVFDVKRFKITVVEVAKDAVSIDKAVWGQSLLEVL